MRVRGRGWGGLRSRWNVVRCLRQNTADEECTCAGIAFGDETGTGEQEFQGVLGGVPAVQRAGVDVGSELVGKHHLDRSLLGKKAERLRGALGGQVELALRRRRFGGLSRGGAAYEREHRQRGAEGSRGGRIGHAS